MPTDRETSLVANRALVMIEQHMDTCDQRYEEWQNRQEQTITYLKEINEKLVKVNDTIAEARGAAKVGKFLIGAIGSIAGFVGGIAGHVVIK